MKVKHGHDIRAPWYQTFGFVSPPCVCEPHLFAQRLGDRCLWWCAALHLLLSDNVTLALASDIRNQHEPQHGKEEDDSVQQQSVESLYHKEGAKQRLREFVGFGIGDDKKHERRNEGVFCLE